MKLKILDQHSCEPVMSQRDTRITFEIDNLEVTAVLCEDKNSKKLGELLVESVKVSGDEKYVGMTAQTYLEEKYDLDSIVDQLT